jgi:hypothetical protein
LILIACKEFIVTAHVGDGAVVLASDPDQLITLSAPTNGTYANETDLLGGSGCIDATVTTLALAPPCRVALLSDGIQRLALATPGLMPHPGLFKPLFAFLEKNDESETQTALTALLQSDLVAARSDDDLTLVLASLA